MKVEFHVSVIAAGAIAFVGIAFFVVSVYQAATCYPGGYDWSRHFLSDLGRVATSRGEPNPQSALIFSRGVIVLAMCMLPFFILAPQQLPRLKPFAVTAGVLSSCGLLGIAFTPYDQYCDLHNLALGLWIVPMLLMMVAFVMDWIDQGRSPFLLLLITGFVFAASTIYLAGFTHSWHVIFQKILVLCAALWILMVTCLISFTITVSISSRNQLAEEQAIEYMSELKRGHRKRRE